MTETAPVSRRQARRQALFLLYQWDLTGLPLESLFEGSPDEFASSLARVVADEAAALDERITAASAIQCTGRIRPRMPLTSRAASSVA
jgi:transcription termination factor NusB